MSILDDAIREHLELKRAHGADEVRAEKARGRGVWAARRAPTMRSVGRGADRVPGRAGHGCGEAAAEANEEPGERRAPNIADLQEPPPPAEAAESRPPPSTPPRSQPSLEQTIPVPHPEPRRADRGRGADAPSEPPIERRSAPPRSGTRSPTSRPNSSTSRRISAPPPRAAEPDR